MPMFQAARDVACIVHAEDKFLVVEETISGDRYEINLPAERTGGELKHSRPPRENCGKRLCGTTTVFYPYASVDCAG